MPDPSSVETCRWARPTIRLPYPHWLEAEAKPWACLRDQEPRPLDDPAVCAGCPRWQSRRLAGSGEGGGSETP